MAALMSLATAKRHLHIVGDDRNADVAAKIDLASATMIDYLKSDAAAAWTMDTVPGPVLAGTLILLEDLYDNRGEDRKNSEQMWEAVKRYVERYRDPALA